MSVHSRLKGQYRKTYSKKRPLQAIQEDDSAFDRLSSIKKAGPNILAKNDARPMNTPTKLTVKRKSVMPKYDITVGVNTVVNACLQRSSLIQETTKQHSLKVSRKKPFRVSPSSDATLQDTDMNSNVSSRVLEGMPECTQEMGETISSSVVPSGLQSHLTGTTAMEGESVSDTELQSGENSSEEYSDTEIPRDKPMVTVHIPAQRTSHRPKLFHHQYRNSSLIEGKSPCGNEMDKLDEISEVPGNQDPYEFLSSSSTLPPSPSLISVDPNCQFQEVQEQRHGHLGKPAGFRHHDSMDHFVESEDPTHTGDKITTAPDKHYLTSTPQAAKHGGKHGKVDNDCQGLTGLDLSCIDIPSEEILLQPMLKERTVNSDEIHVNTYHLSKVESAASSRLPGTLTMLGMEEGTNSCFVTQDGDTAIDSDDSDSQWCSLKTPRMPERTVKNKTPARRQTVVVSKTPTKATEVIPNTGHKAVRGNSAQKKGRADILGKPGKIVLCPGSDTMEFDFEEDTSAALSHATNQSNPKDLTFPSKTKGIGSRIDQKHNSTVKSQASKSISELEKLQDNSVLSHLGDTVGCSLDKEKAVQCFLKTPNSEVSGIKKTRPVQPKKPVKVTSGTAVKRRKRLEYPSHLPEDILILVPETYNRDKVKIMVCKPKSRRL
ncbi:uncharacterized protein [Ptychodera flava]|uniref:uncharacterized protein isoform X2 n=1 Tax=Ptychodera flava TaxID=63121 RepID=UPI00396A271B